MTNAKRSKTESSGRKSSTKRGGYGKPVVWVSSSFNNTDIEWLENNLDNAYTYIFQVIDDLSETLRITVKFDAHTDRFLSTLFFDDPDADSIIGLAIRGATPFDALFGLAYVHCVKQSEWFSDTVASTNANPSRWG